MIIGDNIMIMAGCHNQDMITIDIMILTILILLQIQEDIAILMNFITHNMTEMLTMSAPLAVTIIIMIVVFMKALDELGNFFRSYDNRFANF